MNWNKNKNSIPIHTPFCSTRGNKVSVQLHQTSIPVITLPAFSVGLATAPAPFPSALKKTNPRPGHSHVCPKETCSVTRKTMLVVCACVCVCSPLLNQLSQRAVLPRAE